MSAELLAVAEKESELGKFFFTVVTATTGFLLTAEKMSAAPKLDGWLLGSMLLLVIAMIVAVFMVLVAPPASDDTLANRLRKRRNKAWGFFWTWLIGTGLGVLAILPQ